jgi:hypothetical protein
LSIVNITALTWDIVPAWLLSFDHFFDSRDVKLGIMTAFHAEIDFDPEARVWVGTVEDPAITTECEFYSEMPKAVRGIGAERRSPSPVGWVSADALGAKSRSKTAKLTKPIK